VVAYAAMEQTLGFFQRIRVLPFSEVAATHYADLKATLWRIGTQDLRIAAIALACGGVVVTRNHAHFGQVPGLPPDDWTD
jgi:tRNA(fMet)-specific endonuclease VapC